MDCLVQGTIVESTVSPVVPGILKHEEDGNLVSHLVERGKGDAGAETEVLGHWVEEPEEVSALAH